MKQQINFEALTSFRTSVRNCPNIHIAATDGNGFWIDSVAIAIVKERRQETYDTSYLSNIESEQSIWYT